MITPMYGADLSFIHHAGFGTFAARTAPQLIALLKRHGVRGGRVVEFGCGSGILARQLASVGYDLLGIDVSPAMVRLARRHASGARFRVGSLATSSVPRCDAILAINEVINYVLEPPRRIGRLRRFFVRAHRALRPGGLLVFDFMESPEGRTYRGKSRAGDNWAIVARASFDPRRETLTREIATFRRVDGRFRRGREVHRVRIYDREEISDALTAAGFRFKMRRSYGRVRLMASDVAVIAQKTDAAGITTR